MPKKPRSILKLFFVLILSIYSLVVVTYPVYSDEVDDLESEIEQKQRKLKRKKAYSQISRVGLQIYQTVTIP